MIPAQPARMSAACVYRTVQLTARTSALLFAAAQAASALGPRSGRAPKLLSLTFMGAHAGHFTAVATYAAVNGGRDLFQGARSMNDVGGWPTVAVIYTLLRPCRNRMGRGDAMGRPATPRTASWDKPPCGSWPRCS